MGWVAVVFLVMSVLAAGDVVEVVPGFERFVSSPIFPYLHESHDVAALILGLYVAHRLTPGIGLGAIAWFLFLHIPYAIFTFPHELPEFLRLILMSGAAFLGIRIIAVRKRLEKQFAKQATLDPLTGLMNHKHFHKELERQLALARRYGEQGTILFLDLDGFKAVNDRLGHQTGDELLKRVAEVIPQCLRVTDIVARLGGDEFAVYLPRTDTRHANAAAENIRQAISGLTVGGSLQVSASIGLVAFPDHGDNAERLLIFADRAMYRAKAEGRNRLVVFSLATPQ
ncbi:MAG: GGDEF domain-containing protein [Nitrospirota bacterium]